MISAFADSFPSMHHRRNNILLQPPGLIIGIGAAVVAGGYSLGSIADVTSTCNIKGNVNIDSGERIFHTPGQRRYSETRIRPEYGERWFCSEAEARAAGWRKARS